MRTVRSITRDAARGTGLLAAALLGFVMLSGLTTSPALADDAPAGDAPTEAGTSFRTATAIKQDQQATASASIGDYLYWSFPADSGQRPTVKATVRLSSSPALHATSTWQIDVYDGLRRRQACMYGTQTGRAAPDGGSVRLACTLRPIRAAAGPWANDPLPGTYYIRLTAVGVSVADVGQPVQMSIEAVSHGVSGAYAVGGALGKPLVPGISMAAQSGSDSASSDSSDASRGSDSSDGSHASDASGPSDAGDESVTLSKGEPEDGWSSGWWSDRWIWTGVGGVLAALAGVGGYALTRGRGPGHRVPEQV